MCKLKQPTRYRPHNENHLLCAETLCTASKQRNAATSVDRRSKRRWGDVGCVNCATRHPSTAHIVVVVVRVMVCVCVWKVRRIAISSIPSPFRLKYEWWFVTDKGWDVRYQWIYATDDREQLRFSLLLKRWTIWASKIKMCNKQMRTEKWMNWSNYSPTWRLQSMQVPFRSSLVGPALLRWVYQSCGISRNWTMCRPPNKKRWIQKYTQFTADECVRKVLRFCFAQKTRLINTECHHTLTEKCGVSPLAYHKDDVVVSAVVNSPFAVSVSLFHSSTHSLTHIDMHVLPAYALPRMPLVLFFFCFSSFSISHFLPPLSSFRCARTAHPFKFCSSSSSSLSVVSVGLFTRIMFRNSSQFLCVSFSLRSTTTSNFDRRMHTIARQRSVAHCIRSANMLRREEWMKKNKIKNTRDRLETHLIRLHMRRNAQRWGPQKTANSAIAAVFHLFFLRLVSEFIWPLAFQFIWRGFFKRTVTRCLSAFLPGVLSISSVAATVVATTVFHISLHITLSFCDARHFSQRNTN